MWRICSRRAQGEHRTPGTCPLRAAHIEQAAGVPAPPTERAAVEDERRREQERDRQELEQRDGGVGPLAEKGSYHRQTEEAPNEADGCAKPRRCPPDAHVPDNGAELQDERNGEEVCQQKGRSQHVP